MQNDSLERARRTLDLANVALANGARAEAYRLCQLALVADSSSGEVAVCARRILGRLVPRYHLAMMTDPTRNQAWSTVLASILRPGMTVLELGTGAGMLALMAARTGALVVTCERDPLLAEVAREIVAANGYSDKIRVIAKDAAELTVGDDLDAPAHALICDVFADSLVGFNPVPLIAHAWESLLAPTALVVPLRVRAVCCLAQSRDHGRLTASTVSGFDLAAMNRFIPDSMPIPFGGEAPLEMSAAVVAFTLDLRDRNLQARDRIRQTLEVTRTGTANGLLQWIEMDLDAAATLDSRPTGRVAGFPSPRFFPFSTPYDVHAGERLAIHGSRDHSNLALWIDHQTTDH